ncbi:Serine/threonine-protein kinase atg1 [Aspergillus niger]|uniref:Serine/threonine-protein kinase atg1 n=1 Tax=Aspergillus niger TaxID=5061 RepID=A0A505HS57_ASPNG|nr:Serine/threonine-protein kinase atg1 [Aspergillus niger]
MGVPNNSLHELERQRLELEGNISKLQDSLYHWRTWEAEYDGLKDELNELDDDATMDDYLRVGRDFGGSLVNEAEVKVILGEKQGVTRTKQQAVDLVTRRIDYVKQNASTIEKRLRAAEDQLYALDSQDRLPVEPTADFPMTEIFEELDENGEVISSKTTTPGSEATDLLEVLKKAGVNDIPDVAKADTPVSSSSQQVTQPTEEASFADSLKKDDTSASEEHPVKSSGSEAKETSSELDPTVEVHGERPVMEVDESPEDAKLRREMLQYSLNEVGSVVAELELDEDANYHRQMRELEEKLNARGMWNAGKDTQSLPNEIKQDLDQPSVVRVENNTDASSEPVKEKKPKKKVAFADELDIAPASKPPTLEKKIAPVRESNVPVLQDAVVERTEPAGKQPVQNDAPKKVSRFKSARKTHNAAEDATASTTQSSNTSRPAEPRSALRKSEASTTGSSLPLFPAKPAEPKPFSQPITDIVEKEDPTPRGPEGKVLADTLVERETPAGPAVAPEPDELDEQLHKKEIATEFYKIRNRMIQQNGGFVGEEPEIVPIETEDAPKRVSRFRAARMR